MLAGSRVWMSFLGPWMALLLWLAPSAMWGQEAAAGDTGAIVEPLVAAQESSRQAKTLASHPDYSLVLERAPQVVDQLDKANRFLDWAATAAERSRNNPTPSTRQDAEVLARRASGPTPG